MSLTRDRYEVFHGDYCYSKGLVGLVEVCSVTKWYIYRYGYTRFTLSSSLPELLTLGVI